MIPIRYSQCWEDPGVLRAALKVGPGDDVVSICSAGDNTLALLLDNPRSMAAVDSNVAQLHLLELKMQALLHLDYDDFVGFVGARPASQRTRLFQHLASHLSSDCRNFWESHAGMIERGIIHCGKLERYLNFFRRVILPQLQSRDTIARLLSTTDVSVQDELYRTEWDTRGWRTLFRVFFSRLVMGTIGRDRAYFRYVDGNDPGSELLARTRRGLTQIPGGTNFFLEYMLTGRYDDLGKGPLYLREGNFDVLRRRAPVISLHEEDLTRFLWSAPTGGYSRFNLSDVLEYLSPAEKDNLLCQLARVSRAGGRAAFWSLFVPQDVPSCQRKNIRPRRGLAHSLRQGDRGFFYGGFHVWSLNAHSDQGTMSRRAGSAREVYRHV